MQMTDKMVGKIYSTCDYSQFKRNTYNRGGIKPFDEKHARAVGEHMQKYGQIDPIKVNKNFEIIIGHHRLRGAEIFGIPIEYIISEKEIDENAVAHAHQLNKNWTPEEFVFYYAKKGYPAYQTFIRELSRTGLSVSALYTVIFGQLPTRDKNCGLYWGELIVSSKDFVAYKRRWEHISELISMRERYWSKLMTATKFLQVLLMLIEHPDYDEKHMKRRLEHATIGVELTTVGKLSQGAQMLERFYNTHLRGNKPKIYLGHELEKQVDEKRKK